jgi:hypothetical protein
LMSSLTVRRRCTRVRMTRGRCAISSAGSGSAEMEPSCRAATR